MKKNMKKRARSAVIWTGFDLLLQKLIGFMLAIILAHLLTPEDFGTMALLAFFIGIASVFSDAGFSYALIQRQDVNHVDESTVFWFNFLAAIIIALILFLISPWIAKLYDIYVLQDLLYLVSCLVILNSLGSIHRTLLTKALDFKKQAIVSFLSILVSGMIAIYMAYHEFGVWALACQIMISSCITTLLLWNIHSWRPLFIFNLPSLKKLFEVGGYMFAALLFKVLYEKGYGLFVAKLFGVSQLGVFDRADTTQRMISETMTGVVSKVAFPLYAKYVDDQERLLQIVRMSVRSLMFVMVPLMLVILVLGDLLIPVVLGEQWLSAVPVFQVLCVVGLLYPLQSVNVSVLQAQGYAKLNFRLTVLKRSIGILLLIVGSSWGIIGVAWSMVIGSVLSLFINGYYTKKFLHYSIFLQFKDCLSSVLLGCLMGGRLSLS